MHNDTFRPLAGVKIQLMYVKYDTLCLLPSPCGGKDATAK